jgi:hypothetical protein
VLKGIAQPAILNRQYQVCTPSNYEL